MRDSVYDDTTPKMHHLPLARISLQRVYHDDARVHFEITEQVTSYMTLAQIQHGLLRDHIEALLRCQVYLMWAQSQNDAELRVYEATLRDPQFRLHVVVVVT